ncbi:hypothetical protein ACIP5Y_21525 [Nocardia sp. NPDC088792]|uniref:hypothetical protein n=1 Tax=Nocardia sp. NPDC088792 TaxID=3364332 RepID=UPI0037FA62CC
MAIQASLPAQTAGGSTSTTMLGVFEVSHFETDTVQEVTLTPPPGYTTINGVATNNVTFNFRQLRAGVAVQTFASIALTAGNNLVAETPLQVPITVQPVFESNDVVDVQMVQNGSGLAVVIGVVAAVTVN